MRLAAFTVSPRRVVSRGAIRRTRAYTVIEILVAVTIVAILATIAIVAVRRALAVARVRMTVNEIGDLGTAIQSIKDECDMYPPCMGAITSSQTTGTTYKDRGDLFFFFVRARWPQCMIKYSDLRDAMAANNPMYLYKYKSANGTVTTLNLQTLDQAEALVFWLGGFPAPVTAAGAPTSSKKLIGFSQDPTNPFRFDGGADPAQGRTKPVYEFDPARLVDTDDDGWLEFIPSSVVGAPLPAPYVYFDGPLYSSMVLQTSNVIPFNSYPTLGSTAPYSAGTSAQIAAWGLAVPYAFSVEVNKPIKWANGSSFQIICCGTDGRYSAEGPTSTSMRIPVPGEDGSGIVYRGSNFLTKQGFDIEEQDNLTNFTTGEINDFSGNN